MDVDGSKEFTSIQAAINAATAGDTILVLPGTYFENINFIGKDLLLKSTAGPEATIIDGSTKKEAVVQFRNGESNAAVIEGFRITNGLGSIVGPGYGSHLGGGVFVQNAEPTIRFNHIVGNGTVLGTNAEATSWGGGVYCETRNSSLARSPQIIGNFFHSNEAKNNGGALGITNGRLSPLIRDNVIVHNTAMGGDGGGVWLITIQNGTVIEDNVVEHNYAGDHGGGIYAGGGLFGVPVNLQISHNLVAWNTAVAGGNAEDSGGGLWIQNTNAMVSSNTIVANEGLGPDSTWGGGIALSRQGTPIVRGNVVAHNINGGGIRCNLGVTPIFENNLFWNNAGGEIHGECPLFLGENGNIETDPFICDLEAEILTVAQNSPVLSHPGGPLGAELAVGCPAVGIMLPTTWSAIKMRFRHE